MNFVFLMDPLHTVKVEKDTTYVLMLEAFRRAHKVYHLSDGGITLKNNKVYFQTTEVRPQRDTKNPFVVQKSIELCEDEVDIVFIRTDPPFNEKYLMHTWLLDRLPSYIPIINHPAGLRTANEKLWATQFTTITPQTVVSRHRDQLLTFLAKEKDVIAKPTDAYGGGFVFHVTHGHENAKVTLETLTHNWTKDIILQRYIPEAKHGDKRILLLDGEPLGAVLRVHAPDDHRNNFFSGGKPALTAITAQDKKIINTLRLHLKRLGLYFVGIDIIGNYLIEVNVTSPTCLQEINQLVHKRLEREIIDFAESLIRKFRSKKK